MLAAAKRWVEQITADIAAAGLYSWLKGTALMTVLLGAWEWLQGRSPLEIVLLALFIMLACVGVLELIAKRRLRRQPHTTLPQNAGNGLPAPKTTQTLRDWNIQEALHWWRDVTGKEPSEDGHEFFHDLIQEARDGHITIWERPDSVGLPVNQFSRPLEKIPPEHWRNHDLDRMRYIFGDTEALVREASTPPSSDSRIAERYVDLCVTSSEIKSKWPGENT